MSKYERELRERYVKGQDFKGLLRLVLEDEQSAEYDNGLSALTVSLIEDALKEADKLAAAKGGKQS